MVLPTRDRPELSPENFELTSPTFQEENAVAAETARQVFEYWKTITKHPRSKLDKKREKIIADMVRIGYAEDDLKLAAFGCAHSRWHQGDNDRKTVYDAIELIYKNADKIDSFIRLGEQEIERRKRDKEQQEMMDAATLKASTCGDTYQKERGKLLRIVKKSA